jgi:asparagine synthase (glutamine-hydrolysing)
MVRGIAHRGPDDHGLWSSKDRACVLGHARLSIIDLSAAAHQPMVDPLTGNAMVFNGEIYNFQALRRSCVAAGDAFTSSSDTEVILALYRRHGIGCLQLLRGMFAFALWDEREQRLFLARDRVGKKPLDYALTSTGIAFCSELHPLSRHPGVDRTMDLEALDLYLQCQFVPAPWTIYRGIRKLPPGHYAACDRDGVRLRRYWEVDYRDKLPLDEDAALDAFEAKLTEAVRLRMIADVPLGALLSGGVDSSVVVALMAKIANAPVRTFSVGFRSEAFNELPWAQQAADRCRTTHHAEVIDGNVEGLLRTIARHYGEPFADSSAVPSFLVSATARRHVTVALNGDGGDELLGGYPRYWLSELAIATSAVVGHWLSPRQLAALSPRLQAATSVPMRAVRKLLTQYTHPVLRSVSMFSEFWNDDARRALLPAVSRTVLPAWRRDGLDGAFAHADEAIDRMLWLDTHTYLAGDLLVKMDIASMHCGLETRSPLLDHEVIELCARLPVHLKVKGGVGKYLLKRLAERYYPADFVHRPKRGFAIPLAAWLRGPLRTMLDQTLDDAELMAPLSPTVIAQTRREFDHGRDDHASRLWALLMFGCWRHEEAHA